MGMLAASMGLEQGPEGMKKLTVMMKKGQIGMKELFNFLDMAAKRAKESGAYDLAINSKTATEARMQSSYKLFAESFGKMFDQEIKAPFKGFEKFFDRMSTWIDEQEKLKKETGEIGKFETSVSLVTSLFGDLADAVLMVVEGWGNLLDLLPGGKGIVGKYLANKEMENAYYDYKGARSYSDKQSLANSGMPGFNEFKRTQYFGVDPFATDADYAKFSGGLADNGSGVLGTLAKYSSINMLTNPFGGLIDPQSPSNALSMIGGLLSDLLTTSKESAQAMLDAKYNNPVSPVININGAQDPILIGNVVRDVIKEQTQIGR